jgi:hypothetical protein
LQSKSFFSRKDASFLTSHFSAYLMFFLGGTFNAINQATFISVGFLCLDRVFAMLFYVECVAFIFFF